MSQFTKILKTLDLFSEQQSTLSAEQIADLLGISRPTAFRYVKELCETGLLTRIAGRYALGAKIIELDYRIRRSEPILLASRARMQALAERTASTVILCSLYGDEIILVHHETAGKPVPFSWARGRPLPLFRGSYSAVILANLPAARLKRLYETHRDAPDVLRFASDWTTFARRYREVARAGYYLSREEVDPGVLGIAAPIFHDGRLITGALVVVYEAARAALVNEAGYAQLVRDCAAEITQDILRLADDPQPPVPGQA